MKIPLHFFIANRMRRRNFANRSVSVSLSLVVVAGLASLAQVNAAQPDGRNLSGSLVSSGVVNVGEVAKTRPSEEVATAGPEFSNLLPELRPPMQHTGREVSPRIPSTPRADAVAAATQRNFRGFNGLTHLDQRTARNGNQFSLEPPDQALAVGNGFVLEAVNDALNVYDTNGIQQLARPLALSEFFGLPAEINRTTGRIGPFLTDPVSLFDPETNRWFVLVAAALSKPDGTPLPQSRIFLGVSQTNDPRGAFAIYTLNTTDATDPDGAGPRLPDFPHIGLDRHGFFISVNEFGILPDGSFDGFIGVAIFALSKQALISGGTPAVTRFALPFQTGYEFTVFPANTPPHTDPFLNQGGAEFFVSSRFVNDTERSLAVWALVNTSSLDSIPSLALQMTTVKTQAYHFPSQEAEQKKGFRPLGALVNEPLPKIDSGDFRVLSVVFSAGRLWATLGTEITDGNGDLQMAAAYFAFGPKFTQGQLDASLITQGVVSETGSNLLRPAIAVNAQNQGAMVFTLVGRQDFPSSAFVSIDNLTAGPIRISSRGNEPEDGFTGYPAIVGGNGTARWGDYSAAAVAADGSIWMATEYTPDLARTLFANWSTYITRFKR